MSSSQNEEEPTSAKNILRFDTCIFDLDDTLYPLSSGLAEACRDNIYDYMVEKLGFDPETVGDVARGLYMKHGTTMAGLRAAGYEFDFDDYHAFVHGRLPYHRLRPDPVLQNLLHSMPQRKLVFTNGDRVHAAHCLKNLGIEDCFDLVICFETIMAYQPFERAPLVTEAIAADIDTPDGLLQSWSSSSGPVVCCKPQAEAFRRALALAKAVPERTVFLDDSTQNIRAAKEAGLHTVLVGTSTKSAGADWAVASIHNLHEAIPELWAAAKHLEVLDNAVVVEAVRA